MSSIPGDDDRVDSIFSNPLRGNEFGGIPRVDNMAERNQFGKQTDSHLSQPAHLAARWLRV